MTDSKHVIACFKSKLCDAMQEMEESIANSDGNWVVKGFIDIYQNIYTISGDTKVISRIIELMLFPLISKFVKDNGYKMILCSFQNHYPDMTFIADEDVKIAVDLKSTYRTNHNSVNGFTLGAFTGYFRDRASTKNTTFAYEQYAAHLVLGVIYSRTDVPADERRVYKLEELPTIGSVAKDFKFLLHEKWRIASARPGSGNTKNIGSICNIKELIEGSGPFARHGEEVFDEYWMNYLTADMARAIDSPIPYRNLREFIGWGKRVCNITGDIESEPQVTSEKPKSREMHE